MKVVVVGAGRTGKAVARYYKEKGAEVIINDVRNWNELSNEEREEIIRLGSFVGGGHPSELFRMADKVVVSPGVPKGVFTDLSNVIGDIEDAYREVDGKIVGITGTNGKTTTTLLISRMLSHQNFKVFTGGNIGRPYIEAYGSNYDYMVLELSSFQLEWVESFRARIGILLNVSQDHMDRYSSYEEYLRAKLNLFVNQDADDYAIINVEIAGIEGAMKNMRGSILPFSIFRELSEGAFFIPPDEVVLRVDREKRLRVGSDVLFRVLSYENLLAVLLAGSVFNMEPDDVIDVILRFNPPPHRISYVTTKRGMRFYNDSKATNPSAVINAIRILGAPILLLLGGRNKNLNFDELFSSQEFVRKVRKIIAFGEAGPEIAEKSRWFEPIVVPSLRDAVLAVKEVGKEGDNVLLSPGCASFDEFKNYEERGKRFAELIDEVFGDD